MNADALVPRKIAFNMLCFQAAYWISLAVSAWMWRHIPDGTIRSALILIPALLGVLIAANAYWIYDACDEFIPLRILKCVVITAIVAAACTLVYFFLELFGFPQVSMLAVNLFECSVFNLSLLCVVSRSR